MKYIEMSGRINNNSPLKFFSFRFGDSYRISELCECVRYAGICCIYPGNLLIKLVDSRFKLAYFILISRSICDQISLVAVCVCQEVVIPHY